MMNISFCHKLQNKVLAFKDSFLICVDELQAVCHIYTIILVLDKLHIVTGDVCP